MPLIAMENSGYAVYKGGFRKFARTFVEYESLIANGWSNVNVPAAVTPPLAGVPADITTAIATYLQAHPQPSGTTLTEDPANAGLYGIS